MFDKTLNKMEELGCIEKMVQAHIKTRTEHPEFGNVCVVNHDAIRSALIIELQFIHEKELKELFTKEALDNLTESVAEKVQEGITEEAVQKETEETEDDLDKQAVNGFLDFLNSVAKRFEDK